MGVHERAVILSTGDEIVIGQLQDSNARFLADRLTSLGIRVLEHAAVGDDRALLAATIRRLAESAHLVIMSGGLGPTEGDLTRPAVCDVLGAPLVTDESAFDALRQLLAKRGREVTERQARQAQRPAPARCLPNPFGTAPGLHVPIPVAADHQTADLFCLPGPPGELRPMFESSVVSALRPAPGVRIITRLLYAVGVPEADAVTRLGDLTRRDRNPLVGITASGGVLTLRIRYEGDAPAGHAAALVADAERAARSALGDHIFGSGEQTLPSVVLDQLKARGRSLAVVESCTGGLLGQLVTAVSGSSAAFVGGWLTYSNALKARLVGVPAEMLAAHGAVSEPVARAMALGGLERSGADHALAVTGIAGPDGGSAQKPVGTAWIAHAWREPNGAEADARLFRFTGDREDVRQRAARTALAMLYFALAAPGPIRRAGTLLWQVPPGVR